MLMTYPSHSSTLQAISAHGAAELSVRKGWKASQGKAKYTSDLLFGSLLLTLLRRYLNLESSIMPTEYPAAESPLSSYIKNYYSARQQPYAATSIDALNLW